MNKTCKNCDHWEGFEDEEVIGLCHILPPSGQWVGHKRDQYEGRWPQTNDHDWCGEFKDKMVKFVQDGTGVPGWAPKRDLASENFSQK